MCFENFNKDFRYIGFENQPNTAPFLQRFCSSQPDSKDDGEKMNSRIELQPIILTDDPTVKAICHLAFRLRCR